MKKLVGTVDGENLYQVEKAREAYLIKVLYEDKEVTLGNLLRFMPYSEFNINENLIELSDMTDDKELTWDEIIEAEEQFGVAAHKKTEEEDSDDKEKGV